MTIDHRNLIAFKRALIFCLLLLYLTPSHAFSEEKYVFERMWPTLQQPWYFHNPYDVAVDNNGYIYIADGKNHRIVKMTMDGQIILFWDTSDLEPVSIVVDNNGFVYVAFGFKITKYDANGKYISEWGSYGTGDGQFGNISSMIIDRNGYFYIADVNNYRIQKFSSDGEYILKWGTYGTGDSEFILPFDISVDQNGYVYVTDPHASRIQKFTSEGVLTSWGNDTLPFQPLSIIIDENNTIYVGTSGKIIVYDSNGQFIEEWYMGILESARRMCLDFTGNIYIADDTSDRIHKYTSSGNFISSWGASGNNNGYFFEPYDLALDNNGFIYVADTHNYRIQKFTANGQFLSSRDGFSQPYAIAADNNGFIYVMDFFNIKKLDTNLNLISEWGSYGTGEGEFDDPDGIDVDQEGNVYVADTKNNRIQKFDSDGNFLLSWGTKGTVDGEFDEPAGIAVDLDGYIYVADQYNYRIQKFDSNGNFVAKWGQSGSGNGEFNWPYNVAVDNDGKVYVAEISDTANRRIQIFTSEGQYIAKIEDIGILPGQLNMPTGLAVDNTGRIYVTDVGGNNRIQVFKKVTVEDKTKAIVLAGGGAYSGNSLWDATQMSANFAYRTLTYQGFTKESIYYLSSDTDLDLDNNGVADDVDADATNANLEHAITTWAADAENLVVYLVDHGGEGTFRMSGTETLSTSDLDSWLDQIQAVIPGKVTVIYDACESGSFTPILTPPTEKTRTVITSTSSGESAYFVSQGSISFSNFFWTHIFNGLTIRQAFDLAAESIGQTTEYQHPLLDANGNGTPNETEDFTLTENTYIGNGTEIFGDAPVIGSVSGGNPISGTSSTTLTATGVTDNDGIARVWAIIRPPDYSQGAPDNPVQNLPSIDLMPDIEEGSYSVTYEGFNIEGTYNIAIYARDRIGNTSIPKITTVSVNNPLRRKAIIVAGGPETEEIWEAVENNANLVYEALSYQGYTDEEIYFISPVTFSAGIDGTPTLSNLEYAITTWANDNCKDLVIYMIGNGGYSGFQLNGTETLSASQLDSWLDSLQNNIPGEVTVISDADQSGGFISFLTPPAEKKRFLISGSSGSQEAFFLYEGNISFSRFFWGRVLNGMNIREAFVYAKRAISYCGGQTAQLDDNGNGVPNEKQDGLLSRYYSIGVGIMLAGDDPVIGAVSPEQTISTGSSALIWAENITTTGTIEKVWAVITPPGNNPETATMELVDNSAGRFEGTYTGFTIYGRYAVAIYAMDTEGNVSLPKDTYVFSTSGPDAYENDDSLETANVEVINIARLSMPQRRNFHDEGDQDWVMFYGAGGETYEITTKNPESNCDTVITLYDNKGNVIREVDDCQSGEGEEMLSWQCLENGVYYVMVKQYDPLVYGNNTAYDLNIYIPVGGIPGFLMGMVVNSLGQGVGRAIIKSDISKSTAITLNSGAYIMVLPAGTHTISIEALGYPVKELAGVVITANGETSQNFIVTEDLPNEPPTADAGDDQTVNEGVTVTLNGSGSTDPDDGIASYKWMQISGYTVILSDTASIYPTFTVPDVGQDGDTFTFELTVTDNVGLKSTDTCIVYITGINIKGDVDGSGAVDLRDVMLALQACTKIPVDSGIYTASDVNGDGMIGLEEAIYVMQEIVKSD